MSGRLQRAFVALVVIAALLMPAEFAFAVPSSKLAQARRVKAQIDRLDAQLEVAADNYSEARAAHVSLVRQSNRAAARLKSIKKRMGVLQRHLNTRATSMYRTGQAGFITVLLGARSYEDVVATWDILTALNHKDAQRVAELKGLRAEQKETLADYAAKTRAAKRKRDTMERVYRQAQRDLATRKRKLYGLEAEIAALEAAARRRRHKTHIHEHFPAPTRAPRTRVVALAKRYIGAPYRWAASGPNMFDCSGFTMFVYRMVGVRLPHSSRAQIHYGQRVSRANLRPGDLVFFGSPIHHVGIYVGGGNMIHAPHTGARVRIDPLHSNYAGACRP